MTLANQGLIGIRQRLILPGRVQPSTFSTGELNFCVRDGNRWNLSVIATGNCGYLVASTFSFLPFRKRRVEDPRTLTTAHRMILQTVPISSQFSVSDLLSLDFALLTLRSAILIFSFQALNEAFDRLVSSSSKCYHSFTDDLSPGSLPGVLLLSNGTLILEVGFTLRCLQRLSRPHFASLLCRWHDNSCTSGASIPVLSY